MSELDEWVPQPGEWVIQRVENRCPYLVCKPPDDGSWMSDRLWLQPPGGRPDHYNPSVVQYLRPATPEELAKLQLTSLEGL